MERSNRRLIVNNVNERIQSETRHSSSFVLSIMLLIYMIAYTYIKLFTIGVNDTLGYYLPVGWLACIFLYLVYKLYIYNPNVSILKNDVFVITLLLIYSAIWYVIKRSGLERLLYVLVFLMSCVIYKRYPMQPYEKERVYYAFLFTIIALFFNASTLDSISAEKLNPNTCGLLLMLLFSISLLRYKNNRKASSIIFLILSFIVQFVFGSRTATAGAIMFAALFFIFNRKKQMFRSDMVFWLVIILSVMGIAFAYFYSNMLPKLLGGKDIVIFGKNIFTGRQAVWRVTFETVIANFWFGAGSHMNEIYVEIYDNVTFLNAHNQPLGVLAVFGVVFYIIFYVAIARIVSMPCQTSTKRIKRVSSMPVIFAVVLMMMDFFETNLFHSWSVMIIVAFGLVCSYYSNPNKEKAE